MVTATASVCKSQTLPDVCGIDFSDVREVSAYALLLIKMYEKAGGLSFPKPQTRTIRELTQTGKTLVSLMERRLREAPLSDIHDLSQTYDLPCRLFRQTVPGAFLLGILGASVQKWIAGDRSVSTTEVALMIRRMMEYDPKSVDERWSGFYYNVTDGWLRELETSGHFQAIQLREAYLRLIRLMKDDNKPLHNSGTSIRKMRKEWVTGYLVEDLASLDTDTLTVYSAFVHSAGFNHLLDGRHASLGKAITSELLSRPDLHPFNRRALELDRE